MSRPTSWNATFRDARTFEEQALSFDNSTSRVVMLAWQLFDAHERTKALQR